MFRWKAGSSKKSRPGVDVQVHAAANQAEHAARQVPVVLHGGAAHAEEAKKLGRPDVVEKYSLDRRPLSWQELRTACDAGREQWYGGAGEAPKSQLEWASDNYTFASQQFFPLVAFR